MKVSPSSSGCCRFAGVEDRNSLMELFICTNFHLHANWSIFPVWLENWSLDSPSSCPDLLEHSRLSLGGAYWKLNWQLRRRKRAKSYEPWFKFMQLMIPILRRMLRCRKSWKEFNKKTHPFLPLPRSKFLLLQSWSCLRNDIRIMEMKRSPPYTSLTMKP